MPDNPEKLPWWRYIGPWELRPVVVGILYFLFSGFALQTVIIATYTDYRSGLARALPNNLLATLCVVLTLWIGRYVQRRRNVGIFGYLGIALAAAVFSALVRLPVGTPTIFMGTPAGVVTNIVRSWGFIVVVLTMFGLSTRRLQRQVDRTEEALELAREQQEWMIAADERVRRQVADALHDRVQAGLIAACLQLQDLPTTDVAMRTQLITRLEELRRLDVRRLARSLSPDFSGLSLASALEGLAAQYEPGMVTHIHVDDAVDTLTTQRGSDVLLGSYRIVEQALLNSAIHGRARLCWVDIRYSGDVVSVRIRDDGAGLTRGSQQLGLGAALITTWARALDGSWMWQPANGGGVEVVAELRVN